MPDVTLGDLYRLLDSGADFPVLGLDPESRRLEVGPGAYVRPGHLIISRADVLEFLGMSDEDESGRVGREDLDETDRDLLEDLLAELKETVAEVAAGLDDDGDDR
ncbi:hypothetical protein ACFVZ3_30360 [Kitasatospora purpeofusca]|uniref:hypothetical protein n=1 Tax=Kitasatospora purpeofusca TaxID=67352 RepID=UPI00369BA27E